MRKSIGRLSVWSSVDCMLREHIRNGFCDYIFNVINDNVMFNTVYSVRECCAIVIYEIWIFGSIRSVETKRPIGTPRARGKHEMKFFHLWTIFAAFESIRSIWMWRDLKKTGRGGSELDRESCLHYFIRQLGCGQILAIENTITFLSSHSRPLTHFSFSPTPSMLNSTSRAVESQPKEAPTPKSQRFHWHECENVWRIDKLCSLFSGQVFI